MTIRRCPARSDRTRLRHKFPGQRAFEWRLVSARIVSRSHSPSVGELQLPLDRLEARLFTYQLMNQQSQWPRAARKRRQSPQQLGE